MGWKGEAVKALGQGWLQSKMFDFEREREENLQRLRAQERAEDREHRAAERADDKSFQREMMTEQDERMERRLSAEEKREAARIEAEKSERSTDREWRSSEAEKDRAARLQEAGMRSDRDKQPDWMVGAEQIAGDIKNAVAARDKAQELGDPDALAQANAYLQGALARRDKWMTRVRKERPGELEKYGFFDFDAEEAAKEPAQAAGGFGGFLKPQVPPVQVPLRR